ncbi:MAG: acyloxyacyl hydrolase [Rhizobiales bacterium]|nr:acyloxyacyl hydrolase [Hyphomicrobiales bacterium]
MKLPYALSAAAALLLNAAMATTAQADDAKRWLAPHADMWEARFGGGLYDAGIFGPHDFDGGTINGEVLAPSPDILGRIGSPRPYIGTDVAVSSDPVHFFYAGLNWEARLAGKLYVGFSAGGSVNTDKRLGPRDLGSTVLFHLQASAGLDITENTAFQVYINHYSNAGLAASNDGLDNAGARLALRF